MYFHVRFYMDEKDIKTNSDEKSIPNILDKYGLGYEKKEKPKKKILGNINFGMESPFYNVNKKKMKKNRRSL